MTALNSCGISVNPIKTGSFIVNIFSIVSRRVEFGFAVKG